MARNSKTKLLKCTFAWIFRGATSTSDVLVALLKEQTEDQQKNTQGIRMKEQQDLEEPYEVAKVQNKFTKRLAKAKGVFLK